MKKIKKEASSLKKGSERECSKIDENIPNTIIAITIVTILLITYSAPAFLI
jgi:hypothetical protein